MPATRSSAVAGPSRLSYIPQATRRTTFAGSGSRIDQPQEQDDAEQEDDAFLDVLLMPITSKTRRKTQPRARSVSFQPSEFEASTPRPRAIRHRRTGSGGSQSHHSHQSIYLSPPARPLKLAKPAVRKSLTGSTVLGMTINDRAEILADVAGDCLVTLVKAASTTGKVRPRRSGPEDEVKKVWEGLHALRHSYFFPTYSPPFPLFADILESLHSHVRASLDPTYLHRAVSLSNIATFVYTILRSEEAGDLIESLGSEEPEEPTALVTRSKGKGRMPQVDPAFLKRVERRNDILLLAWKRFWQVVVPTTKRSSESALRLWLDFSTQLVLTHQVPMIGADMYHETTLPGPPPTLVQNLFSPSAVGRYGQWAITQDWDSQPTDQEKNNVEERWSTMARKRLDEIHSSQLGDLLRKYPYDTFRQEMVAYIQHEVLTSPADPALTPNRRRLLIRSSQEQFLAPAMKKSRSSAESTSDADLEHGETELADWSDHRTSSSESDDENEDNTAIDLDLLLQVAQEMEAEQDPSDTSKAGNRSRPDYSPLAHDGDQQSLDSGSDDYHPLDLQHDHEDTNGEEEDEWAVRDYVPPVSRINLSKNRPNGRTQLGNPKFDWTARQADAMQIEWDSQSVDGPEAVNDAQDMSISPASEIDNGEVSDDNNTGPAIGPPIPPMTSMAGRPAEHEMIGLPNSRSSEDQNCPPDFGRLAPQDLRNYSLKKDGHSPPPLRVTGGSVVGTTAGHAAFVTLTDDEEDAQMDKHAPGSGVSQQLGSPIAQPSRDRSQPRLDAIEDDDEFGDLLPDHQEFSRMLDDGNSGSENDNVAVPQNPQSDIPIIDIPHRQPQISIAEPGAKKNGPSLIPARPASQAAFISKRPRKNEEANQFALPDENEDLEDRQLLERAPSREPTLLSSRAASQSPKPEPLSPIILNVHHFVQRVPVPPAKRLPRAFMQGARTEDDDDPFLYDEDGSPLDPDELYIVPEDHQTPKSRLHGRVNQFSFRYCRLSGPRKWTREEELLLYRTVQKVPYEEQYPLNVVAALHGEFGMMSHRLKWFNTQHMKDKMRSTVARRLNERRPVVGRARAWAKKGSKEKEAYEKEMKEWQRILREEAEAAEAAGEDQDEDHGSQNEMQHNGDEGGEGDTDADQGQESADEGNGVAGGEAGDANLARKDENIQRFGSRGKKGSRARDVSRGNEISHRQSRRKKRSASIELTVRRKPNKPAILEENLEPGSESETSQMSRGPRSNASVNDDDDDNEDFPEPSSFRALALPKPSPTPQTRRSVRPTSPNTKRAAHAGGSKSPQPRRAKGRARKRALAQSSESEDSGAASPRPAKRSSHSAGSPPTSPARNGSRAKTAAVEKSSRAQRSASQTQDAHEFPHEDERALTPPSKEKAPTPPRRERARSKGAKTKSKGRDKDETVKDRAIEETGPQSAAAEAAEVQSQVVQMDTDGDKLMPSGTEGAREILVPASLATIPRDGPESDNRLRDSDDGNQDNNLVDEAEPEEEDRGKEKKTQGNLETDAAPNDTDIGFEHATVVPDTYDQPQVATKVDEEDTRGGNNDVLGRETDHQGHGDDQDASNIQSGDNNDRDQDQEHIHDQNDANDRNEEGITAIEEGDQAAEPEKDVQLGRNVTEATGDESGGEEEDEDDESSEKNKAKRRAEIARKVEGHRNTHVR
ncbi:hypothetical protein I316_07109 [Kwoniella heveanensis BCC8398]|uniref:Uncharacterized protein n=1 Tax=Kwoniella heveanensis BCC8398 TaxID=1296120 RepID=A0A1B9GJ75_9TREE|nr:hypothetical protein I316_07109 [Kwoniella heveanensis BCC8398]